MFEFSKTHTRLPRKTRVFCLRTVNLLRKYSLVFDLPMSFVLAPVAYIAGMGTDSASFAEFI